ncbi:hypothetical protein SA496_18375 [Pseudomonas sp. JS3066]|jgi:hypothetical protein|uniref:hypothetical protein n=1 Tax=unclassified Pseudomonas TaxID=196821 RepID=UPI00129ED1F7|nr:MULTISPECIES: hypothetical protein [unclassified Pseudomonas]MDH4654924.1 hypothetical protein [Pseudomonas sp. BN606]MRK19415.1 hypothetical protein [Pseudomonas sp. JG-B]WVK91678.1 hypothetical protein SA496_18375 [Pseudomonas sp. JS3066]
MHIEKLIETLSPESSFLLGTVLRELLAGRDPLHEEGPGDPGQPDEPSQPHEPGEPTIPDEPPPAPVV